MSLVAVLPKTRDDGAADLPTPESMSDAPYTAPTRVARTTSVASGSGSGGARQSSLDAGGGYPQAESSTDAQRRAEKLLKERHLVASIDDWWTRVVSMRNRLSDDAKASLASQRETLPVPKKDEVSSVRLTVEELPRLLERYLPENHGVGDMAKHLSQLWTKALNSKDFAIVETRRYGEPELDLVATRDIKRQQQIKGLSGRLFPVHYGEDPDYNTDDVGFNNRLVFGSTRRVGKNGKKRKTQHVSKLGLGPLRLLNHSCMYNVAWLQSKPPGSQYPLPQMSVFASRDIKKGEVLYAYYNDAYFGEGNYACLCGHNEKHGQPPSDTDSEDEDSDEDGTPVRRMSSVKKVFRKVSSGSDAHSKQTKAPSPEPVPEPDLRTVIDLTGFDDDDGDDVATRRKPKYREYLYMGRTGIDLTLVDDGDDGDEDDDALARKDREEASMLEREGYEETGSRMRAPRISWIKSEVKQEPADGSPSQPIRRAAQAETSPSPTAPLAARDRDRGSRTPRAASEKPAGEAAGQQDAKRSKRSASKERDHSYNDHVDSSHNDSGPDGSGIASAEPRTPDPRKAMPSAGIRKATPPATSSNSREDSSEDASPRVPFPVSSTRGRSVRQPALVQAVAHPAHLGAEASRTEASRGGDGGPAAPLASDSHFRPATEKELPAASLPFTELDVPTMDSRDVNPSSPIDDDVVMGEAPASARSLSPPPVTIPLKRRRSVEQQLWRGWEIPLAKGFGAAWPYIPDTPLREEEIIRCPLSQASQNL